MALRIIKKAKAKMAVATKYGFCKCGSVANATDVAWEYQLKIWLKGE